MVLQFNGAESVTGSHTIQIPFRFAPRNPQAAYTDTPPPPPMCGPAPSADTVTATAVNLGSAFRPHWVLELTYAVGSGTRTFAWTCGL